MVYVQFGNDSQSGSKQGRLYNITHALACLECAVCLSLSTESKSLVLITGPGTTVPTKQFISAVSEVVETLCLWVNSVCNLIHGHRELPSNFTRPSNSIHLPK